MLLYIACCYTLHVVIHCMLLYSLHVVIQFACCYTVCMLLYSLHVVIHCMLLYIACCYTLHVVIHCMLLYSLHSVYKSKAIPVQVWRGPEDSRRLRLTDFKTLGT
jgi:hypothetical protein